MDETLLPLVSALCGRRVTTGMARAAWMLLCRVRGKVVAAVVFADVLDERRGPESRLLSDPGTAYDRRVVGFARRPR